MSEFKTTLGMVTLANSVAIVGLGVYLTRQNMVLKEEIKRDMTNSFQYIGKSLTEIGQKIQQMDKEIKILSKENKLLKRQLALSASIKGNSQRPRQVSFGDNSEDFSTTSQPPRRVGSSNEAGVSIRNPPSRIAELNDDDEIDFELSNSEGEEVSVENVMNYIPR